MHTFCVQRCLYTLQIYTEILVNNAKKNPMNDTAGNGRA
jgi:hypothetical protein